MKTIKLLSLKLHNFKGIRSLEIDFEGNDTKIFGENGTGKTTIFDAFVFLLFNKDSNNNATFDIKTLDDNGNVIHRLDHEVEATLLIDEKQLTLKKVYKERWTKQRGSVTESFSGHTTDYFIDGVPSKKKEYDEMIQSIVDEDAFQLLTNPSYFNEVLHWKVRRDLLLEIAGDITDEDVIASRKDLGKLLDVLNGNSIDDHKKIIAAKRREINKQLDEIPTRIDEINRNMPHFDDLIDATGIDLHISSLDEQINKKQKEINSIENGSEINELKKQISDIELKIANVRNEHTQNEQEQLFKFKTRLQEEQSNLTIMRNDLRNLEQQKQSNERHIKDLEQQMDDLRNEYVDENAKEFDHDANCTCPTCDQDLPQDQVTEIATKFNLNKAKKLESINEKGKSFKKQVGELKNENESLQKQIDKITEQGKKKSNDVERLKEKIEKAESSVTRVEENADYIKLNDKKQALVQQIEQLMKSIESSIKVISDEIDVIKDEQQNLQVELAKYKQAETNKKRIAELEQQQKQLSAEFEELEHQLFLTEEFTRRKVKMLTENINNKFKYARFKLFEEQINGGLKEVCETTFEGVPYSSGLNNAAKINVGLDIINTLSEHFGVQAPIFVDNAESVTKLIDIDAQVISLVVSADDKELRVEAKATDESVVA